MLRCRICAIELKRRLKGHILAENYWQVAQWHWERGFGRRNQDSNVKRRWSLREYGANVRASALVERIGKLLRTMLSMVT